MAEEDKPEEVGEPVVAPAFEITPLAGLAIEIHELYLELQKSGFTRSEALTLSGMVLSSTATVERGAPFDMDDDEDIDLGDEDFDNWDTVFKEHEEKNPEDEETT